MGSPIMFFYNNSPCGHAIAFLLLVCTVAAVDNPYDPDAVPSDLINPDLREDLLTTPPVSESSRSLDQSAVKTALGGISIKFRNTKKKVMKSHLPVPMRLIVNAAPTAAPSLSTMELQKQRAAKKVARAKAQTKKRLASILKRLPHGEDEAEGVEANEAMLLQLENEVGQPVAMSSWRDDDVLDDTPLRHVLKKGEFHFVDNKKVEAAEKRKRDAEHKKQMAKAHFLLSSTSLSYDDDNDDIVPHSYAERHVKEERKAIEEHIRGKQHKKLKKKSTAKPLNAKRERMRAAMKSALHSSQVHDLPLSKQRAKMHDALVAAEKQAEIEEKFDAKQRLQKAHEVTKAKAKAKAKAREALKEKQVNFLTTSVFSSTEGPAQAKEAAEDAKSTDFAAQLLDPTPPSPHRAVNMDSDFFVNALEMIGNNAEKEFSLGDIDHHIQKKREDQMQAKAAKLLAKVRQSKPSHTKPVALSVRPPKLSPSALVAKLKKAAMFKQASNLQDAINRKAAALAMRKSVLHKKKGEHGPEVPDVFDAAPTVNKQIKEATDVHPLPFTFEKRTMDNLVGTNRVPVSFKQALGRSKTEVLPFEMKQKRLVRHKALLPFTMVEKPKTARTRPHALKAHTPLSFKVGPSAKSASAPPALPDTHVSDDIEIEVEGPDAELKVDGIEVPTADVVVDVDI